MDISLVIYDNLINFKGKDSHLISEAEASAFGLMHGERVFDFAKDYFGKKPREYNYLFDDKWKNIYQYFNWDPIKTEVTVYEAKINEIESTPIIIAVKNFTNLSNKKATFNAGITTEVSNSVEANWTRTENIGIQQELNYGIQYSGSGLSGTTTFNFSHSWGKGGSQTQTITLGSSSGISVELEPKESVRAELIAHKSNIKIKLKYIASIDGMLAFKFYRFFSGYEYNATNVKNYLNSYQMPLMKFMDEEIDIHLFTNSSIVLKDLKGNMVQKYDLN